MRLIHRNRFSVALFVCLFRSSTNADLHGALEGVVVARHVRHDGALVRFERADQICVCIDTLSACPTRPIIQRVSLRIPFYHPRSQPRDWSSMTSLPHHSTALIGRRRPVAGRGLAVKGSSTIEKRKEKKTRRPPSSRANPMAANPTGTAMIPSGSNMRGMSKYFSATSKARLRFFSGSSCATKETA